MQIMVTSTGLCLAAARFGLAPSVKKVSAPSLKLSDRDMDLVTNDPAGFTAADTLAMGAAGHAIGVGIVLGLKGIGAL
jgi:photosystem I subunit 10